MICMEVLAVSVFERDLTFSGILWDGKKFDNLCVEMTFNIFSLDI